MVENDDGVELFSVKVSAAQGRPNAVYRVSVADSGLPEVGVFRRSAKNEAYNRSAADTLAKRK